VRKWKTDERQLRAHAVGAATVATAHADNASSEPGKLTAAFDGSMEIASYTQGDSDAISLFHIYAAWF